MMGDSTWGVNPESYRNLNHWRDELNSAALYRGLAALEKNPKRARVYRQLGALEAQHAEVWANKLRQEGTPPPAFQPAWRTRLLLFLGRYLGTALLLPRLAALEQREAASYLYGSSKSELYNEEQANATLLAEFSQHEVGEFFKKLIVRLRRSVILVLGLTLFFVSLLLARNVQLEGLFFGLLAGILVGPVMHYLLGKLIVALPFGRIWCGWACWTAAVMDQLPYRKSAGWLPKNYRRLRYVHFFSSLGLVLLLFLGFGYGAGALGENAAIWFLAGNGFYWLSAVALAVTLKDNRAFCKYLCPVSVILKLTSRPALLKVSGDAEACLGCASKACTTLCPMDIDIPAYIEQGKRVLSTECILCQHCVAICPPNTLGLSFGLDLAGEEVLEQRLPKRGLQHPNPRASFSPWRQK